MENNSDIVNKLMFDYQSFSTSEIQSLATNLPLKLLRWLGAKHPDNRTRRIFFEMSNVIIGIDTVINSEFIISDNYKPLLTIGKRVAISPNVIVICASAPNNSLLSSNQYVKTKLVVENPVIIGDDSWIGAGAIILPGVSIGKNCIIGAGSVVTKDVADNTISAGNPSKIIKPINYEY